MIIEVNLWKHKTKSQYTFAGNVNINRGEQVLKFPVLLPISAFLAKSPITDLVKQNELKSALSTRSDRTYAAWLNTKGDFVLWDYDEAGINVVLNDNIYKISVARSVSDQLGRKITKLPDVVFRSSVL